MKKKADKNMPTPRHCIVAKNSMALLTKSMHGGGYANKKNLKILLFTSITPNYLRHARGPNVVARRS